MTIRAALIAVGHILVVLSLAEAKSFSHRQENADLDLWQPGGNRTREDWLRCHGFPCSQWDRTRRKLFDLQMACAELGQNTTTQTGHVSRNMDTSYEVDTLDKCIWLTEYQIDRILNQFDSKHRSVWESGFGRSTAFNQGLIKKWPTTIHWKFDGKHRSDERDIIRGAFRHWEANTCIRFVELDTNFNFSDSHLLITRESSGCHSFVGRIQNIPQQLNLQHGCTTKFGTPVHEIGHVLGLFHEQQRADRDTYVRVLWQNLGAYAGQFYKQSTDDLRPYDYSSVMHYGPLVGGKKRQPTMEAMDSSYQQVMGQRTGLSFLDSKLINNIYCSEVCNKALPRPCEHGGYQDPNDCAKCKCPDGFAGDFCQTVAPPRNAVCGGLMSLNDATSEAPMLIQSPGYDTVQYYTGHQECTWWFKAPVGERIYMEFENDFGVFCGQQRECLHWVEVRSGANLATQGPRFCCYKPPNSTITSQGSEMMVVFKTNMTQHYKWKQRGFQAKIWTESIPTTPTPTDRTTPSVKPSTHSPGVVPAAQSTPNPGCSDLDLVLIMDTTTKDNRRLQLGLNFFEALIESLSQNIKRIRVSLVTFAQQPITQFHLNSYNDVSDVIGAISDLSLSPSAESSNFYVGLHAARGEFLKSKNVDSQKVALLLTEGGNSNSWGAIIEAQAARVERITLYIVGIGKNVNTQEATWMTGNIDHVHRLDSSEKLQHSYFLRDMRSSICPYTDMWTCSFEKGSEPFCGMLQSKADDFDWTRHKGSTPSAVTGPDMAQDGNYYIYIEATEREPGDRAVLSFPSLGNTGVYCVTFHYNMYGFHINTLELVQNEGTASRSDLWRMIGEVGTEWNKAQTEVDLKQGDTLSFVGIRGDEYSGDIAVDNITATYGQCLQT